MIFKTRIFLWSITLAVVLYSCTKPEEDTEIQPPISAILEIKIERMFPKVINQFESVTFHISYTDGNADLGDEDADDHALEIIDQRDSILHTFHVPPQSPIPNIIISGVLEVDIENVILLDQNNSTESATFKIRLRDKAGHWSPSVVSPTLTINK